MVYAYWNDCTTLFKANLLCLSPQNDALFILQNISCAMKQRLRSNAAEGKYVNQLVHLLPYRDDGSLCDLLKSLASSFIALWYRVYALGWQIEGLVTAGILAKLNVNSHMDIIMSLSFSTQSRTISDPAEYGYSKHITAHQECIQYIPSFHIFPNHFRPLQMCDLEKQIVQPYLLDFLIHVNSTVLSLSYQRLMTLLILILYLQAALYIVY